MSHNYTDLCHGHAHCPTCRDLEGGREWRQSIRRAFKGLSQDDFPCPEGYGWGEYPSRGLGDTVAKITKRLGIPPCGGCKGRQKTLNQHFPYKGKESKDERATGQGAGGTGHGGRV